MHRQNKITAALVQQQHSLFLPPRDIPIFEGDPFTYRAFVKAFKHVAGGRASKAVCLFYLEPFTKGQPHELVRSRQHMDPASGYAMGKGPLQEHFGIHHKTATAYMEKALVWQSIKCDKVNALQAYSLFLQGKNIFDMPVNMRTIVSKLPFKMRDQWRAKAQEIMERTNGRAHIKNLVAFTQRHVRILSNPLFGNILDPGLGAAGPKTLTRFKAQPSDRIWVSIDATSVTSINRPERKEDPKKIRKAGCLCCAQGHTLDECRELNAESIRRKFNFCRKKGVCFACLCVGHVSRDCKRCLTCNVCEQTYPTALHINRQIALSTTSVRYN